MYIYIFLNTLCNHSTARAKYKGRGTKKETKRAKKEGDYTKLCDCIDLNVHICVHVIL